MKKLLGCLALVTALAMSSPSSAGLIGSLDGPDDSFSINMHFTNTGGSDIVSLTLDGSTATAFPILWDSIGTQGGSAAPADSVAGVDTQTVTFSFPVGAFANGDTFDLIGMDPDGVPSPISVTVAELMGVSAQALFADANVTSGVFVDDTGEFKGLILEQITSVVPLPAAAPLLATALVGLGFAGYRRKGNAA